MFYVINNAIRRTVSSTMWLATGMGGEGIWLTSSPPEAAKSVSRSPLVPVFRSPIPATDDDPSSSRPASPSPLITILSRPTFPRASTSATLVDVDPFPSESRQKHSTGLKGAELSDCLRDHNLFSKSVALAEGTNFDQRIPIHPSTVVHQRRGKKRVSKHMARWAADPLDRGIRASRPVTGVERLARLQRLNLAV